MPEPGGRIAGDDILIGTAGWSIPRAVADRFPGDGSHLERYARRFSAVEINSSFHRPHRLATYQRWAAAVPPAFRFSVKLPRAITHAHRLADAEDLIAAFAAETAGLGEKLAAALVQLPPSLAFDATIADAFFAALKRHVAADIACEPRHPSWFSGDAEACLVRHRIARVAADPALAPGADRPGGWRGLQYHRLHGAPRTYYSAYDEPRLRAIADEFRRGEAAAARWCIFDNTASGAATSDALALQATLQD